MQIIALQDYTDKYVSLYEGEIRIIPKNLAERLIEQGIVAEHNDEILPNISTADNGKILTVVNGEWKAAENSGGGTQLTFDDSPTYNSHNPVTSHGIKTALDQIDFSVAQDEELNADVDYILGHHTGMSGHNALWYPTETVISNKIEDYFENINTVVSSDDDAPDGQNGAYVLFKDSNNNFSWIGIQILADLLANAS